MRTRFITAAAIACCLAAPRAAPSRSAALPDLRTVVDVPATASHHYTLAGRIRPLLFWIGRDHVGFARITWHEGVGVRGYELLVGSDPASAPRGINRWGYIAETATAAGGTAFALMTGSDEASYRDASARATQPTPGEFRAIRSTIADGLATWQTTRVPSERRLTIHDLETAVQAVRAERSDATVRARPVTNAIRPGFLTAVAELMARGDQAGAGRRELAYAFGQRTYALRLTRTGTTTEHVADTPLRAIVHEFEIVPPSGGDRTRFVVTSAAEGPLAGVPLRVAWQPHWWLGLELRLADASAAAAP